ncbi:hypothetical protein BZARG_3109 [Bizionia argentinensis JUB59]|uniref:Uncharacterized protein n=1 Tax=Bizionia argentinensis JUB59 TaxID=1046627 RepID=G2EBF6_9FLAO|nr:hypothetical protein [Bizionia argentinensis]EGV44230.1 hypothetical protein BZARG_3109 [Bizionia argentinensis JUB59]
MRNAITLIFILLFFLSCKQKQTEYINTENNSEISKIVESETEKGTENKVENVVAEKISNCDLKTLVEINSLLEKGTELNDQNFAVFFANMNPECSNNAEYSEFNNELIFKTLESNPKKFVAFLSRVSKKKKILEFVLTQLRNPIHDGIELNAIYESLGKTETEDAKTKELVSESIKNAIEKNN